MADDSFKRLKAYDICGLSVHQILQDFNERRDELEIADDQIVSISVRDAGPHPPMVACANEMRPATVAVTFFYWERK